MRQDVIERTKNETEFDILAKERVVIRDGIGKKKNGKKKKAELIMKQKFVPNVDAGH